MTVSDDRGESARKDAIVVAGMHRSGTSAMTRVLSLAGAALPTNLLPPNPTNSEGHWEPLDVTILNDEIFSKVDSSWDDLFGPRYIRSRKPPIHRYLARARKIIQENYHDEDLIVLKDPRISILPELWHHALADEGYRVSYVLMVRNPREVADSLKKRNGFTENKSLIMWATHMLSAELFTRNKNRIFINYDELFLDTESLLDKVEGALKIRMPRRTWASMISIQDFVKVAQRHHRIDNENNALTTFPEIARFYAYLTATTKGEIWNEDVSADLAEWLSRLESATAPIIKTLESTLAANSAQSAARETQLKQDVERLETALREAEHLSTDLTRRLEEARLNQVNLEALNESAKTEFTEQLARAERRILALEASLGEARKLNDELGHTHEESEARASAAALAQADLVAAHAAETHELTAKLTELSNEIEGARRQAEQSANEIAQISVERAEAIQTAAELRTSLAEERTESGRREADLSERLSGALRVVADKDVALASSGAELAALSQSMAAQEGELRRQIAEGRGHSLEMERRLADSEARVAQVETEKSAADRALQELNARLERSFAESLRRRLQRLKLWPQ